MVCDISYFCFFKRIFCLASLWVDHEKLSQCNLVVCVCTTFLIDEKVAGKAVGRPLQAQGEGEPIGMYFIFLFCRYYPCTIVLFCCECSFVLFFYFLFLFLICFVCFMLSFVFGRWLCCSMFCFSYF